MLFLFVSFIVALSGRAAQDVSTAAAAMHQGQAAIKVRDLETAAAAFGRACALAPGEADSCYYSGQTLHMLGRFEEAPQAFERAVAHVSYQAKARVQRAAE